MKAEPRIYIANGICPGGTAEPKGGCALGGHCPHFQSCLELCRARGTSPVLRCCGRADNSPLEPSSFSWGFEGFEQSWTNPTKTVWGCSCESGVQEDLLVWSWLGHDTVAGNLTLLAARGMGRVGLALPCMMPPAGMDGASGASGASGDSRPRLSGA